MHKIPAAPVTTARHVAWLICVKSPDRNAAAAFLFFPFHNTFLEALKS